MSMDLVVYYSLEGNTEYVASVLKEKIGADLVQRKHLRSWLNV